MRSVFGAFDRIATKKLEEMEDLFADPKPAFRFLDLHLEIRDMIWEYVADDRSNYQCSIGGVVVPSLAATCQQCAVEGLASLSRRVVWELDLAKPHDNLPADYSSNHRFVAPAIVTENLQIRDILVEVKMKAPFRWRHHDDWRAICGRLPRGSEYAVVIEYVCRKRSKNPVTRRLGLDKSKIRGNSKDWKALKGMLDQDIAASMTSSGDGRRWFALKELNLIIELMREGSAQYGSPRLRRLWTSPFDFIPEIHQGWNRVLPSFYPLR